MKKTIKVDILKKLLCSLLLFTILSQIAVPVLATDTNSETTKSYAEWLKVLGQSTGNLKVDHSKITEEVKSKIMSALGKSELIVKPILEKEENKTKIKIKATYKTESETISLESWRKISEFNISEIYLEGKQDKGIEGLRELFGDDESGDGDIKTYTYDELKTELGRTDSEEDIKFIDDKIIAAIKRIYFNSNEYTNPSEQAAYENKFNEAVKLIVADKKENMSYQAKIIKNAEDEVTYSNIERSKFTRRRLGSTY